MSDGDQGNEAQQLIQYYNQERFSSLEVPVVLAKYSLEGVLQLKDRSEKRWVVVEKHTMDILVEQI